MTENLNVRPCEKDEPMNPEWEWQAQVAAERHLEACRAVFYHEDEHPYDVLCDDCPPEVSTAPFDDCPTCIIREVGSVLWPIFAEMAVAEYISLPAGGKPSWRR